ncbi:MAG: hypothetical protein KDM81_12265, partial [Verrucomicrobiae bacterium]|nr:hypothetical protein [Verrucomicrobiae bacterium]
MESFGKLDWLLASRQGGHWRLADGRIRLIRDGEVVRDLGTYPWFGTGFPVSAACEDPAGNLVVGVFGAGVYRFDAGGTMRHSGVAEGLSSDYVLSLATDLEDSLWVGTDGGGLNRIRREPFATIQTTLGQVVQAITRDQDGALWVGYNGGGLECLYEGFDLLLMTVDDLAAVPDSGNRLAVIVRNRADDTLHFRVFDLMGQAVVDNPESDFPDKPGEIAGLKSLLSPLWGQETPTPDQQKAVIDAVDSVVGLPHLGQFRQGLLQAPVRALLCDRANRVWVGLWGGGVIQWRDGRMDPIPSAGLTVVFALHEDRDGKIWVGGDGGLARWDGGEWRRFTTRDGLSSNRVRALADDAAGRLWVGTSDAGLNRFDGREFTAYRRSPDGLPGDRVVTLHVARDDALWVGTEGDGLARFSGDRWIRAGIAEGLPSNDVGFFLEDAQTNLWIGTTAGLLRVGRDTLRAWVAGETSRIEGRVYERADGLPTCECTLGPGMDLPHLNAGEDRLWLPTIKGLATAVASAVVPNRFAPPVRIESVAIEGRTEDGAGLRAPPIRRVTLPPDRRRLEVHYTSLNLGAPDRARFRYRLRDHDDSWTDAGDVRVAHFTKLSPGEYTFEVEAANEDGVWSAEPAMLTVIVEPPFWRTWWFLLVSGGAVLGAVIATVHLISTQRLKRQVAVLRQQEALER